jgi:hypothetical protein
MVKKVVGLLLGEYIGEAPKFEELLGRVADDPCRVFANNTNREPAICFFFQGNEEAKGLHGAWSVDWLILTVLKSPVAACNDGMAVVGRDVSKANCCERLI